ncbi:MAG TPA: hypothetical protein VH280_07005 [Verrucomicrobiae bacterium]|jgi:hypothetical protein|nr:hypothetical protein [Verrucomicrobiae bacterium]
MNEKPPAYNWNGLWLVEWNEEQKSFHIECAQTRFTDSLQAFALKQNSGAWIALGIFNSRNEAQLCVDLLRAKRGL